MQRFLMAAMLAAAVMAPTMSAAADPTPMTAQQQKLKDCNAEAKTQALKGQPRKDFMKSCLNVIAGGAPAAAAPAVTGKKTSQKEKMKSCNADAKTQGLKGHPRKNFMKSCLKA